MRPPAGSSPPAASCTLRSPMPLDRIQLAGIKSIREMDLPIRQLNVVIGANGAGKSNLIGAFGLLSQLVEGRLQTAVARAGGASVLLHRGPKRT
jgi:predicted ATPase